MSNLGLGVYRNGWADGLFVAIKNLMQNMNLTISAAMDLLSIPQSDRPKYEAMLKAAQ